MEKNGINLTMTIIRVLSACMAALFLAGCGESGRVFGLDRTGPDEFSVVRNRPLSVPPDVTLRPPEPGTAQATRNRSIDQARATLQTAGTEPVAGGAPQSWQPAAASPGETALVRRVTAYYGVEPDIRRIVDEESHQLVLEQEKLLYTVMFWQDPPEPGTALDADAESRRLRENEALGKPVNSGIAPVIVRKKSGVSSLY